MLGTDWTTAAWFLPFVIPIAIWALWSDLTTMKIPNKSVLALLAVFVVIGLIALPFTEYLWRYAHFAVVLVIGFLLSSFAGMGAGDAKFMAAMAPFVALSDAGFFLVLLGFTTLMALIIHSIIRYTPFLKRQFPNWESLKRKEDQSFRKRDIPLGFGLSPALVLYLALAFVNG